MPSIVPRWVLALAVVLAMTAAPAPARADDAPTPAGQTRAAARPTKRPVPDYDGRPAAPTTAVDVLLWVPRVVLFPVRLVVDYVIRRPLGALVRAVEGSRTARRVFRYLFLQPRTPTPSIYPVALYDFGFKPSIGLRMVWIDGFLTRGSRLAVKLGIGGADLWRADVTARLALGPTYVELFTGARKRDDAVFYGLGPDAPAEARARYQVRHLAASARLGAAVTGYGEASVFAATTDALFAESRYAGDRSIEDQVALGRIAGLPTGYPGGYGTQRVGAAIAFDSRQGAKTEGSGVRVDATYERVRDVDDHARSWNRLELVAGAALLLDPVAERKLDLRVRYQRVTAAMDVAVPFLELATAGGGRDLRGFPGGRLYGETALAVLVDYHWPLAAWLDANAHLGAGNAFGPSLAGLHAGALRGSAGLGISIAGLSADREVELSGAIATEPLGAGLDVSSWRLVLGYTHDY